MTIKEKVLSYLKEHPQGMGPTEIGLGIGKDYDTASSAVTPALRQLVNQGLVERVVSSPGRIIYKAI